MKDQVPEQIKTKRSAALLALDEEKRREYEAYWMGREVEVLVEETIEKDGKTLQTGHTKEYIRVALECEQPLANEIVTRRIGNDSQIVH